MTQSVIGPGANGRLQLGKRVEAGIQTDIENWPTCRDAQTWCYREGVKAEFFVERISLPIRACLTLSLISDQAMLLSDLVLAINRVEGDFGRGRLPQDRRLFERQATQRVVLSILAKLERLEMAHVDRVDVKEGDSPSTRAKKMGSFLVRRTSTGEAFMRALN